VPEGTAATIDRIDVFGYELTYAHGDYVMSSGRVVNRLPSTLVRVTTRDGAEGFGEVCPLGSTYLPAFGEGARVAIRELAPALIGADATNLADVHRRLDDRLKGHEYAKSALDVACWDAFGRLVGKPVAALLGGVLQRELPLYVAIPLGTPASMAAFVARERSGGIRNFQAKLGAEPAEDAQRVAAILAATGPGDAVIGDANGAWRRQDAIIAARLFEGFERFRLEQPCPTLVRAAGLDAMDQINLKISRVGGLLPARLMRDVAVRLGIRLMIEDSWGGDVVTAAVAHLAAGTPPEALFAVSFMNDWTTEHIAGYQPRSSLGMGPVPEGPGLGIEVDVAGLGSPLFTVAAQR